MGKSIGMKGVDSQKCLKMRYAYYVRTSYILLVGTGKRKNNTIASGSSSIEIHYFDDHKRFINRINEI